MRLHLLLAGLLVLAGCAEPDVEALDTDGDGFADSDELAAGTDPQDAASVPIAAPAPVVEGPLWGGPNAPIRPGMPIGWCTYNFLFYSPSNDTYYIGTAAHCTDELGQRMPLAGFQDEIGTVVYDSDNATQSGSNADFSLVQLDEGLNLQAFPQVVNRVGPVGYTLAADVSFGDLIQHHGYGMVFGDLEKTRDRDGYFSGWSGEPGTDYCSESPIWWGDSGSPVLHGDSGKAFGIVSRAGWFDCVPTAQLMGATVEYILAELAEYGWDGVELATV